MAQSMLTKVNAHWVVLARQILTGLKLGLLVILSLPLLLTACGGAEQEQEPGGGPVIDSAMGLTVRVNGPHQVDLSWASVPGAARYQIYLSGNPTPLAEVSGTTYTHSGATAGAAYTYQIRAIDAAGGGVRASSNVTVVTPMTGGAEGSPSAPVGITAIARGPNHVSLSWENGAGQVQAVRYRVFRSDQTAGALAETSAARYDDLTVSGGTSYSYYVYAIDAENDLSPRSGTATVVTPEGTDTSAPTAPLNLSAQSPSSTRVDLVWTASQDNVGVVKYLITRSDLVDVLAETTDTAYVDSSVVGGTKYSYQVRAADAANNLSGGSNIASVQTGENNDKTAPTVPGSVVAKAVSSTQVDISWAPSTDNEGVTKYQISRAGYPGILAETTLTNYSDTTVVGSSTYVYQVRALDAANNHSDWSVTAVANTPLETDKLAPSTPAGLSAKAQNATLVNLSWIASTDNVGVSKYQIFRTGVAGVLAETTATTYADTTVVGATNYTYRVKALDAANNASGLSSGTFVMTPAAPDTVAPSVPTGVTAKAQSATQVNLSWTASTDNIGVSKYQIFRIGVAGVLAETTGTSYTDTTVVGATKYTYQIKAMDAANNTSVVSASASVTTPAAPDTTAPSTPTGLLAKAQSTTQINLSWTASTDNVGVSKYQILRVGVAGVLAETTGTGYADMTVVAGTKYTYQVRAMDAANNASGTSGSASATTPAVLDTVAPSVPTGLIATAQSAKQVNLNWAPSTDNVGVSKYQIFRTGTAGVLAETTATSYSDLSVVGGTSYTYQVKALDAANNASALSANAVVTTPVVADTTPPSIPTNVNALANSATQVDISWTASTDNVGVAKYQVFRAGTATPIAETASTGYSDKTVTANTNYSYQIKAFDAAGNVSGLSATASVKTPIATQSLTLSGCTRDELQSVLNTVANGTIINIPAGDCDWGSAPAVKTKAGVWLKGAGKNATFIRRTAAVIPLPYNGVPCTASLYYDADNKLQLVPCEGNPPPQEFLIEFDCSNNPKIEISGISFIGNDGGQNETQRIIDEDNGVGLINGCKDFKIHDSAFNKFSNAGLYVKGASRGVIYSNDFLSNWKCQDKNTIIPRGDGTNWNFTEPLSCEGYGVVVYGDNTWPATVTLGTKEAVYIENNNMLDNRHAIASNSGSKYVVRYNQIDHTERARNYGIIDAHGKTGSGPGSRSWEIYENTLIDNTTTKNNTTGIGIRGGDGVIFNNVVPKQYAWPFALTTETSCTSSNYPLEGQPRSVYAWGNHAPGSAGLVSPTIEYKINSPACIKLNQELFLTPKSGYMPYTYPHPLRNVTLF